MTISHPFLHILMRDYSLIREDYSSNNRLLRVFLRVYEFTDIAPMHYNCSALPDPPPTGGSHPTPRDPLATPWDPPPTPRDPPPPCTVVCSLRAVQGGDPAV